MKPVRLEVRGFTAFREPTCVEFEGRRLFVITGPTGAGKSSLLDAMMWALYGQVPRVGRGVKELISQGEREMSVLFEFTVRGQPYRVARRFPATNSTRLERLVKDQWVPVADKATEVTKGVESILGMDYQTFTRAIVLPQGQFDSFLKGDAKDRRAILSQLIGLGIYQEAAAIARARASSSRTRAEAIRAQLEQLQFATPERIEVLRSAIGDLEREEATLAARRKSLVSLRELATEERERRTAYDSAARASEEATRELQAAEEALKQYTKRAQDGRQAVERAEKDRSALSYDREAHDRLKAQVTLLDQREAAEAALVAAKQEAETARVAVAAATEVLGAANASLESAKAEASTATLAETAATRDLAAVAGRALRARTQAEEALATLEQKAADLDASARAAEQRVRDLDALAAAAQEASRDVEAATRHAERAAQETEAARKASEVAGAARDDAVTAAEEARAALDHARMEDAASAIRAGLKVGDPCPVCGEPIAKVSRHKATDLAKAQKVLDAAERALADARTRAEQEAARAASAAARAEEAERARAAAEARLAALGKQADELGASLAALDAAMKAARSEATAASESVTTARTEATAQRETVQALRDALARVPEAVELAEAKRGSAAPDDLRASLEGYRSALADAAAANTALEAAQRVAQDAEREREAAERDLARAEKACADAEWRLTDLGGVEGEPGAIRQALADADVLATRVEEAAEAVRAAREALASAEASATAAVATVDRDRERLAARQAECASAQAALQEARSALEVAWGTTVGAEPAPSLRALKDVMEQHEAEQTRVTGALAQARAQVQQAEAQVEQAARMRTEATEQQAASDLAGAVATELRGDRFIAFLLQESMQLLATDASDRLSQFTSGRYELVAEDDEFLVVDRLNGDEQRSVKTLSGGETFLASLALALALSEHLPEISGTGGAVSLDSLFLDEGFGALDVEALDLAVQGLETLAEGSRMVGVISHVDELADRLTDRIRVEKGVHGSTIAV